MHPRQHVVEDVKAASAREVRSFCSELSATDKRVALAIAESVDGKVSDVRQLAGMSTNEFNPYRDRLIKRGIVDGSTHGYVSFTLPAFDQYVMSQGELPLSG